MITREKALELLYRHVKNEKMIFHSLASEAVMRGLARSLGGGYLTPYIWSGINDIIPFVIIIIVIMVKPYGLFGEKRIERI